MANRFIAELSIIKISFIIDIDRKKSTYTNNKKKYITATFKMNDEAQNWANHLVPRTKLFHNPNNKSYGENITMLKLLKPNVGERVVDLWHNCIAYVNVNDDESKLCSEENIGVMTQLLWKSSTEIGVGVGKNADKKFYTIVVNYFPRGNKPNMFVNNLPEFKQEDIDEGKNQLKSYNLQRIFISNSEKNIPKQNLKDDRVVETRESILPKLDEKFNSKRNPVGLSHAEARRIRNQVLIRSNFYRAKYNLILFEITEEQNNDAQHRANNLAINGVNLEHDENIKYGKIEYLVNTTIFGDIGEIAVDEWYNNIGNVPEIMTTKYFDGGTGCLTQLLWRKSVDIGVGVSFLSKERRFCIVVLFFMRGNIPEIFSQNLPVIKKEDIALGVKAQKEYSELRLVSSYMRSKINKISENS